MQISSGLGRAGLNGRAAVVAALLQGFDWAYDRAVEGIPGLDGAAELAAGYAARHPTPDAAVAALIRRQSGIASVAGFVTGCGGFVALPIAMPANLASALYIQVRLIAAIAHLRGHDIRSPEVRGLVLACLTGSKAADTVRDAGVRFGTRVTRDVLGWVSPAVLKKARHTAHLAPLAHVTGQGVARLGKFVPLVGGVVAGGFDAAMTQLVGRSADRLFVASKPAATTVAEPDIILQ